MIAAMILRMATHLGVPAWMVQAVLGLVLLAALAGAAAFEVHHIYHSGELAAEARDAIREKANSDRADKELARLNDRVRVVQAALDGARAFVAQLQKEMTDEKAASDDLQRRLRAGDVRLSVLTRQRPADQAQSPGSTAVGRLDQEPAVESDLDQEVAANLVGLTSEGDQAIIRLAACIIRYDKVKAAADAMP